MHDQDTARIAVRARQGSAPSYAIVDADVATWASQYYWFLDDDGYVICLHGVDGKRVTLRLHRKVLGLTTGDGLQGDHINRDKLDNRRANLRIATTRSQQMQNQPSHRDSSSKYRGVSWDKVTRKWKAQVWATGKYTTLGRFTDELEAAKVARAARARLLPYAVD